MGCTAAKEDQPPIVIFQDILIAQDEGDLVETHPSCEVATDRAEAQRPNVAVFDIVLCESECTGVAKSLVHRNMPFAVYFGSMASSTELNAVFRRSARVPTPSFESELLTAVRAAVALGKQAFYAVRPVCQLRVRA
jgi:hypothetical protein